MALQSKLDYKKLLPEYEKEIDELNLKMKVAIALRKKKQTLYGEIMKIDKENQEMRRRLSNLEEEYKIIKKTK